jgi:tRNA threonylcarbamoyladenosine biosynthesis protein TsaB
LVTVLGLDCASSSCSVAALIDRDIASSRQVAMERGQAEALLPMIDAVLAEARLDVSALDLIAVTVGPGSFTGVRTGLATARGLALASGRPLIGVTCFEVAAHAVSRDAAGLPLLVALESKRAELFLQRFDRDGPGEPALVPASAWSSFAPTGPFVVAGDGAQRFAAGLERKDLRIAEPPAHANAITAAHLGAERWKNGTRLPPPAPLYLRAPDVTVAPTRGKPAP